MSSVAIDSHLHKATRFYQASIGKKAVMALTGVVLFGYLVGHLAGNLQVYLGAAQMDRYAAFLHSMPALLWGVRVLLLICVVAHITASIQLTLLKQEARPDGYAKREAIGSSSASRTMIWSGPMIAAFVIYHLLHLTTGHGQRALPGTARVRKSRLQLPAASGFGILHPGDDAAVHAPVSRAVEHVPVAGIQPSALHAG